MMGLESARQTQVPVNLGAFVHFVSKSGIKSKIVLAIFGLFFTFFSTNSAADLTGVWTVEYAGKCWTEVSESQCSGPAPGGSRLTLNEAQGEVTGHFYGAFSSWLRPKPDDAPDANINSDGTIPIQAASFDGTTLNLSLSFKLCSVPGCTPENYSWELTWDKDNPNILTGIQRQWGGTLASGQLNHQVRLNREGGPIVHVRDPSAGGSWVPWILIPGIGWVLYKLARKGRKKREEEPKEYELDIRTQDDRTNLTTDGEDLLWVYAQVRCNKPEVNTEALTSGLAFTAEGTDSKWLLLGAPQSTNGFKAVPVRAWPPSEDAQLAEGEAKVTVSAVIETKRISGPVTIRLEDEPQLKVSILG
ncbi:hypothetical protein [Methylobacter sp. BlB1]|uniref:hypothetical protein n=1 Tax=Methylobacter sp. BlB1 TaxID=2785914 RepID=UPI001893ED70|nr:hypothetical protein [Methylobacter sp. BlB1]MBF6650993.1 hypothetical protein [Methylobacter sp. BlB1]